MSRTSLRSMSYGNIGAFCEPSSVTFTDGGLVLIDGQNLDTGGSSASGKTTFLEILAFALGYSSESIAALQSWFTETPLWVELVLDSPVGEVVVLRNPKLKLKINGENFEGSAAEKEQKLTEIIGLSHDMLPALTYRGQGKRGLFISMGDTAKKEFLANLLGLDKIEEQIEKQNQVVKQLEIAKNAYLQRIQETEVTYKKEDLVFEQIDLLYDLHHEIAVLKQRKSELEGLLVEYDLALKGASEYDTEQTGKFFDEMDKVIKEQEVKIQDIKSRQPIDNTEFSFIDTSDLQKQLDILLAEDTAKKKSFDKNVKEIANLRTEFVLEEQNISNKIKDLESQKEALEKNNCPKCSQIWVNAQEELSALNESLKGLVPSLSFIQYRIGTIVDPIPPISDTMITLIQCRIQDIGYKNSQIEQYRKTQLAILQSTKEKDLVECQLAIQTARDEAAKRSSEYRSGSTARTPVVQKAIDKAKVDLQVVKDEINTKTTQYRLQEAENRRRSEANDRRKQHTTLLSKLRGEYEGSYEEFKIESDIRDLLKDFLGNIFDEVLYDISNRANSILAGIPNTSNCTVQFKSETVTQKGVVKKTITPVVTISNKETTWNRFSGGQKAAAELAVDFALGEVVSLRTGSFPGWLVLDESFEGLGRVEKEGALELIQRHASNRLVFIVDHNSEFKEMFTSTITIVHSNGRSVIR